MTINRQWTHQTAYDMNGIGVAEASASVSGNVVLTGGGWAEPIDYSNTNQNSTSTVPGNTGTGLCPIAWMFTEYDSVGNNTYLNVGFATSPNTKVRAHLYVQWES